MTNLVFDASIAKACGKSTAMYPTPMQCRNFLIELQKSHYDVVMTEDVQSEWKEYSSDFTKQWQCAMARKGRLKTIPNPEADLEIRNSIEPMAKTDQERVAINKDILLLEAALANDKRIVSLDENAIYKYYVANKSSVNKFHQLIWINPINITENSTEWLQNIMSPDSKLVKIAEKIIEDWGGKPQSRICMAILDYLLKINTADSSHITYSFLQESIKQSEKAATEDQDLWLAIQYLCGERVHLLEAKFELIDEGTSFPISNSVLKNARKTGKLTHPKSSKIISDFEDKVFIYFQPSSLVQSMSV
jgi:hypothetical protein